MRLVLATLLISMIGCKSEPQTCFNDSKVSCIKFVDIRNPDCLSFNSEKTIYIAGTPAVHAAIIASTNSSRNVANAAANRRRREKSCKERPTVPDCVEWKVIK